MPGAEAEIKEIWAILRQGAKRQAATDARMDRANSRMDRAEARMARVDARAALMDARFEKRMRGFEKLARIGMREMADLRKFARQSDERMEQRSKEIDHKI